MITDCKEYEIIEIGPETTREIAIYYHKTKRSVEGMILKNIPNDYTILKWHYIENNMPTTDRFIPGPIIHCKVRKKTEGEIYNEQLEYFINSLGTIESSQDIRLEKRLTMLSEGICSGCGQKTKDWEPVFGSFAPEWWATMRENGIDPATGHKLNCKRN
jgi:hypothetical protein